MAILLEPYKLAYLPVPKCACTAMKILCYSLANGEKWNREKHGVSSIHGLPGYKSCKFDKSMAAVPADYTAFAIVRHPISRLVSAYRNKLVGEREKTQATLPDGIVLPDTFEGFVDRLEELQQNSRVILQHTRPMTHFLGTDPDYFGHLYNIRNMRPLQKWLQQETGRQIRIKRTNKSSSDVSAKELPAPIRRQLKRMFADDFELFTRVRDTGRAQASPPA